LISKKSRHFAAIKHVDTDIDLEDPELKQYLLENYGIKNTTRLYKKKDQVKLKVVRIEINEKDN
jgi:hypothetical protein